MPQPFLPPSFPQQRVKTVESLPFLFGSTSTSVHAIIAIHDASARSCIAGFGRADIPSKSERTGFSGIWRIWHSALCSLIITVFFLVALVSMTLVSAHAQSTAPVIFSGDAVVSGFSGATRQSGGVYIDVSGASLKIFNLNGLPLPRGQVITPPVRFSVPASAIGQVFGLTLDNADPPNVYAGATSVYGLPIVGPDSNGDGMPDVLTRGQAQARFMDGLFGPGGGPGTIWRIDGRNGQATPLVTLNNSGPGLGDVAFDPAHYQLYASDLDSGLIWRIDLAGNLLGSFDHGQKGRPMAGLPAVSDDGRTAAITQPNFDPTDPSTWGYTDVRRRVWALAYYNGRLYYSVEDGPQIWSVGITNTGDFANDARVEIAQVPGRQPVTDILFTPRGEMILAQRGGVTGDLTFMRLHQGGGSRVLRYRPDGRGGWLLPAEEYAVGFAGTNRNAAGGVGLSCGGMLWMTGDDLRNDPTLAATLTLDGALEVYGLQGVDSRLTLPRNQPPWAALYVDYDGRFGDAGRAGLVGDVEIYRWCTDDAGRYDRTESWPGWDVIVDWSPPSGWTPPPWWPTTPDLRIQKDDTLCTPDPANPGDLLCTFRITVTNVSAATFAGTLTLSDAVPPNVQYVPPPGGSVGWACGQPGGTGTPVSCASTASVSLAPGASVTLLLTVRRLAAFPGLIVRNCAMLTVPGDPAGNNDDCGWAYPPGPDLEIHKTLNACVPVPGGALCNYWLDVINVGNAVYTGTLHVNDVLPASAVYVGVASASSPAWTCVAGGGQVDCLLSPVTLAPGAMAWVEISIFVPNGAPAGQRNCARLGMPEHAADPDINGNNRDCAPVVAPKAGPPIVLPRCPSGWLRQALGWTPPPGWQRQVITRNGRRVVCGRKTPPPVQPIQCPNGWWRYPSLNQVPPGWRVQKIGTGRRQIICAQPAPNPPTPQPTGQGCAPGEKAYRSRTDAPAGWLVRPVRTRRGRILWCARPPRRPAPIACGRGERPFASRRAVPPGWRVRRVSRGGQVLWCAKPGRRHPVPSCAPGERRFASRRAIPRGWAGRLVQRNGIVYWCARPVRSHPRPPRPHRPHCPPGTHPYHGRCIPVQHRPPKPHRPQCPPGTIPLKHGCIRIPVITPEPPHHPQPRPHAPDHPVGPDND